MFWNVKLRYEIVVSRYKQQEPLPAESEIEDSYYHRKGPACCIVNKQEPAPNIVAAQSCLYKLLYVRVVVIKPVNPRQLVDVCGRS